MFDFRQDGRVALIARLAALIVCPPLLAAAYAAYCGSVWYAIVLAYAPIAGGWIGLASRPVFDAAADRKDPRYEFSGKGAVIGCSVAFLLALAFAPPHADRRTLVVLFVASSLVYYAIGKVGCGFLGCCRAIASRATRVPLPTIEASASILLGIATLAAIHGQASLASWSLAAIVCAFLVVRIYSRWARGSSVRDAFRHFDSIALVVWALWAALSTTM